MLLCITRTTMELLKKGEDCRAFFLVLIKFIIELIFSKLPFSDEHTKLVWVLNLYLIETTSKFGNDVGILSNTVISANNILKRTNNIDQYLSILHVSTTDHFWKIQTIHQKSQIVRVYGAIRMLKSEVKLRTLELVWCQFVYWLFNAFSPNLSKH